MPPGSDRRVGPVPCWSRSGRSAEGDADCAVQEAVDDERAVHSCGDEALRRHRVRPLSPPAPRGRPRTRRRPRPGPAARRLAAGRCHRRPPQWRRGAAGHRRRAHPPGPRRADACPEHGATQRSTAGRCWCTAPALFAGGSTTDSPSRATNRSPTASSTLKASSSTSATVTPPTPADACSAPLSSRCREPYRVARESRPCEAMRRRAARGVTCKPSGML